MESWDGVTMQDALLNCRICYETVVTDSGPGSRYYLVLGPRVIPLGINEDFANSLQFALVRNAKEFDRPRPPSAK